MSFEKKTFASSFWKSEKNVKYVFSNTGAGIPVVQAAVRQWSMKKMWSPANVFPWLGSVCCWHRWLADMKGIRPVAICTNIPFQFKWMKWTMGTSLLGADADHVLESRCTSTCLHWLLQLSFLHHLLLMPVLLVLHKIFLYSILASIWLISCHRGYSGKDSFPFW